MPPPRIFGLEPPLVLVFEGLVLVLGGRTFLAKSLLEDLSEHHRLDVGNFSVFEVQQPHLMDNDLLFAL